MPFAKNTAANSIPHQYRVEPVRKLFQPNGFALKTNFKLKQCIVRLERLSQKQILSMIENSLTKFEERSTYNLRKRERKINGESRAKPIRPKARNAEHRIIKPSDLSATSLKTDISEIIPKLLCLAKMNTYSPWPAMVLEVAGKRVKVYFFGEAITERLVLQK